MQHRRVLDVEVDEPDLLDGSRRSNVAEQPRLFRDVERDLALRQQGHAEAERDCKSHVCGMCKVRTVCLVGARTLGAAAAHERDRNSHGCPPSTHLRRAGPRAPARICRKLEGQPHPT